MRCPDLGGGRVRSWRQAPELEDVVGGGDTYVEGGRTGDTAAARAAASADGCTMRHTSDGVSLDQRRTVRAVPDAVQVTTVPLLQCRRASESVEISPLLHEPVGVNRMHGWVGVT